MQRHRDALQLRIEARDFGVKESERAGDRPVVGCRPLDFRIEAGDFRVGDDERRESVEVEHRKLEAKHRKVVDLKEKVRDETR